MKLGWKVLIPVSLVWLMLVATVRALKNEGYDFQQIVLYVAGGAVALLLISLVVDFFRRARDGGRRRTATGPSTRWPAASPCRRCPDRACRPCRADGRARTAS